MKYLITGGSGSGKSTWAEKLVRALPESEKFYIATMKVYDDESVERVKRHRLQREGLGMTTIEMPANVSQAQISGGSAILIEDVPNLLANEMFGGGDPGRIAGDIYALSLKARDAVIVTNDVFSDGMSYGEGTMEYMRRLAGINAALARICDCVVEVVCSIPLCVKGELPCV